MTKLEHKLLEVPKIWKAKASASRLLLERRLVSFHISIPLGCKKVGSISHSLSTGDSQVIFSKTKLLSQIKNDITAKDPVLFSYESAMAELINNQQMALAGFLAASALAHLPIQPELSPIKSPDLPPSDASRSKRLEVDGKGAIKKSPAPPSRQIPNKSKPILGYAEPATGIPPEVMKQAKIQEQRLRFLLERQRQSLKRAMSIGKNEILRANKMINIHQKAEAANC